MKVIKFSHDYEKLPENPDGKEVKLIKIEVVFLENLSPSFIEYDTKFRGEEGYYELPKKGKYLCLSFIDYSSLREFTTLRRWTEQKAKYYFSSHREMFVIQIENVKPHGRT